MLMWCCAQCAQRPASPGRALKDRLVANVILYGLPELARCKGCKDGSIGTSEAALYAARCGAQQMRQQPRWSNLQTLLASACNVYDVRDCWAQHRGVHGDWSSQRRHAGSPVSSFPAAACDIVWHATVLEMLQRSLQTHTTATKRIESARTHRAQTPPMLPAQA